MKPGGINGWHVIKSIICQYYGNLTWCARAESFPCQKFPQLSGDARIPTHASLVNIFVSVVRKCRFCLWQLKRVQFMTSEFRCTVWFHFIRSVWPAILGVLFHAASWHGETNVIMKLSHYAIILTMKSRCMWFQKIRLRGFEKWIFFYNHYFWVFVFISESLKDILVFNFLFCIIYPIKILIIKPWFYLW